MNRSMPLLLLLSFAALVVGGCSTLLDVDFNSFGPAEAGTPPPVCKTCQDLGAECGIQADGCGNTLDCGETCPQQNYTCDGLQCICTPKSCEQLGIACDIVDDGCGHPLDCGQCNAGLSCVSNQCECVAQTCATLGSPQCGTYPTGCGTDTINCGATCASATPNCVSGSCSANPCTPKSCADVGNPCDTEADGCGGLVGPCATCKAPDSCGGAGKAHECGCTAKTCAQVGNPCDAVPDGCGGTVGPCVACKAPDTCGGAGIAHTCGCKKTGTCPINTNCGTVPDGCGGNVSCGPNCTLPNTCGGGGTSNVCGCTPNGSCSNCCGAGTDNCGKACTGATCCGGGGCFPAGMPVLLADGSTRAIENVNVGDSILTRSASRGVVATTVTELDRHGPESSHDGILVIDGALRVTPNHAFYTSQGPVRADHLHVGDEVVRIVNIGGRPVARAQIIQTIAREPGDVPVFTLKTATGDPFVVDTYVMEQKQ